MHTLHHLLDYVASAAIHLNWYVLAGGMILCAIVVGLAVRRL